MPPKPRLIVSDPDAPKVRPAISTGVFGMLLFLVSLAVVFIGSLVAYLMIRANAPMWRSADMPPLPMGLWASTVLLFSMSATLHAALRAVRRHRQRLLRQMLVASCALACAFLASQVYNWRTLIAQDLAPDTKSLYSFTFYMLTGLHAVHVIGGLVPLAFVTRQAFLGRYSPVFYSGVLYQVMYWHFLDGAWVVLFAAMLIAT